MTLANCAECGKVYNQIRDKLCRDCRDARDVEVDEVKRYLRRKPGNSIVEAAEATGVEEERILDFIREGDIELMEKPADMNLHCEVCGTAITQGRKCGTCQEKFMNQFKKAASSIDPGAPKKEKDDRSSATRMYTVDHLKKKE